MEKAKAEKLELQEAKLAADLAELEAKRAQEASDQAQQAENDVVTTPNVWGDALLKKMQAEELAKEMEKKNKEIQRNLHSERGLVTKFLQQYNSIVRKQLQYNL